LHGYVLDDVSGVMTPREWALAVGKVYQAWRADRVLGETNQGGALVEENLRMNSETHALSYSGVHVHEGKRLRAEPCAALYEQVKVHHVGGFTGLEDQMTQWDPTITEDGSPDRVDALVQALTDLLVEPPPVKFTPYPGLIKMRR
jgi:phage terminase large subunit-like protein